MKALLRAVPFVCFLLFIQLALAQKLIVVHYHSWYSPWNIAGYANYIPVLGREYYWRDLDQLIDDHIELAKEHGIDAFSLSWQPNRAITSWKVLKEIYKADEPLSEPAILGFEDATIEHFEQGSYGWVRVVALQQDGNVAYGWFDVPTWKWDVSLDERVVIEVEVRISNISILDPETAWLRFAIVASFTNGTHQFYPEFDFWNSNASYPHEEPGEYVFYSWDVREAKLWPNIREGKWYTFTFDVSPNVKQVFEDVYAACDGICNYTSFYIVGEAPNPPGYGEEYDPYLNFTLEVRNFKVFVGELPDPRPVNQHLYKLIDVLDQTGMKWFFFTEKDPLLDHPPGSLYNFTKDLKRFKDLPTYLKIDGKPVVATYAVWTFPTEDLKYFRDYVEERVGPIYLVGDFYNPIAKLPFEDCRPQVGLALGEFEVWVRLKSLDGEVGSLKFYLVWEGPEAILLESSNKTSSTEYEWLYYGKFYWNGTLRLRYSDWSSTNLVVDALAFGYRSHFTGQRFEIVHQAEDYNASNTIVIDDSDALNGKAVVSTGGNTYFWRSIPKIVESNFDSYLEGIFDAYSAYYIPVEMRNYTECMVNIYRYLRGRGLSFWKWATPGFNCTYAKWCKWVNEKYPDHPYPSKENLLGMLRLAKAMNPSIIYIVSWNELMEGTNIEPTLEQGDVLLKALGSFALEWKAEITEGFVCSVKPACDADEVEFILLSDLSEAHAGFPGYSTYPHKVCCSGEGVTTDCSGNYVEVLRLSDLDNAHLEHPTNENYLHVACLSAPYPMKCTYSWGCPLGYACLLSVSNESSLFTNAHGGDCDAHLNKVCCMVVDSPEFVRFDLEGSLDYFKVEWEIDYAYSDRQVHVNCTFHGIEARDCQPKPHVHELTPSDGSCMVLSPPYNLTGESRIVCTAYDPENPDAKTEINHAFMAFDYHASMAKLISVTVGEDVSLPISVLNRGLVSDNYTIRLSTTSPAIVIRKGALTTKTLKKGEIAAGSLSFRPLYTGEASVQVEVSSGSLPDIKGCPSPGKGYCEVRVVTGMSVLPGLNPEGIVWMFLIVLILLLSGKVKLR